VYFLVVHSFARRSELRRCWAAPPRTTPSSALAPVSCPWLSPLCHPKLACALPQHPRPSSWPWSRPCLRQNFVAESGGATASRPATQAGPTIRSKAPIWDLTAWLLLNLTRSQSSDSDLAARIHALAHSLQLGSTRQSVSPSGH
jgi:hypothetical protein